MALGPGKVRVNVSLYHRDVEWLRRYAETQERTLSAELTLLIRQLRAKVEQGDRP